MLDNIILDISKVYAVWDLSIAIMFTVFSFMGIKSPSLLIAEVSISLFFIPTLIAVFSAAGLAPYSSDDFVRFVTEQYIIMIILFIMSLSEGWIGCGGKIIAIILVVKKAIALEQLNVF
jgi:hypothetical protein